MIKESKKRKKFHVNEGKFQLENEFIEPKVLISYEGKTIVQQESIASICSTSKNWKTEVLLEMIMGTMSKSNDPNCLKFTYPTPIKRIIYIDYEQPNSVFEKRLRAAFKRRKIKNTPSKLFAYNKRNEPISERLDTLEDACKEIQPDIVFIDGITDLLLNANEETESTLLMERITSIIFDTKCCFVFVIHETASNSKARGHTGSILERKCDSLISINRMKDTDTRALILKLSRLCKDGLLTNMEYNQDKKRLEITGNEAPSLNPKNNGSYKKVSDKKGIKNKRIGVCSKEDIENLRTVINSNSDLNYKGLRDKLAEHLKKDSWDAGAIVTAAYESKIIRYHKGFYIMNDSTCSTD